MGVEDASVKHTEVESEMIERVVMPAVKRAFAGVSLEVGGWRSPGGFGERQIHLS